MKPIRKICTREMKRNESAYLSHDVAKKTSEEKELLGVDSRISKDKIMS